MKNTFKILGIIALSAIIGFAFTACKEDDSDDTNGGGSAALTVTGLSAYNGKYFYGTNGSTIHAMAANGSAALISNGSVSLSVKTEAGANYTGTGSVILYFYAFKSANIASEMQGAGTPVGSITVNFNNGNGGSVEYTAAE